MIVFRAMFLGFGVEVIFYGTEVAATLFFHATGQTSDQRSIHFLHFLYGNSMQGYNDVRFDWQIIITASSDSAWFLLANFP
jgi:hypothetical protein